MPRDSFPTNYPVTPDACRYRNIWPQIVNAGTGELFAWIRCLGCMEVVDAVCLDAGECPRCSERFTRPERLDRQVA
jgi:uncharacterized paraquat-inducible protein A